MLAYGIAQAQAFRDGNRRTADFATQTFLHASDLGIVSPSSTSDHTLARYLNQVVARQSQMMPAPGSQKFLALFSRRLRIRKRP